MPNGLELFKFFTDPLNAQVGIVFEVGGIHRKWRGFRAILKGWEDEVILPTKCLKRILSGQVVNCRFHVNRQFLTNYWPVRIRFQERVS